MSNIENKNNVDKLNRITFFQLGILITTVITRVLLQMMLPIVARASYSDDDELMVEYAKSVFNGNWLGEYNVHTLNKKPIFAVLLAYFKSFNVPYMLWTGLLYAMACVIFFYVIRKWIKNFWGSYLCMLFLMMSPVMFDDYIAQCVYRMSIVPALILLIVSSYLAIYFDRKQGIFGNWFWILIASISLSVYSLSREEASWIKCFLLGAILVLFVLYIIDNGFKFKKQFFYTIFLIIPLIVSELSGVALKTINYNVYGVFAETDFNDTYYETVCKDIVSIKPTKEVNNCYVTKDTLDRCMEYSETLGTLKKKVDWFYNNPSTPGLKNGELKSGNFAWILRWSAGACDVYTSAKDANNFYKKVHEELSKGFEDGTFEKKDAIILSGISRPIKTKDIPDIMEYAFSGIWNMAGYEKLGPEYKEPLGTASQIQDMADMTSTNITGTGIDKYTFKGWIFARDENSHVDIEIYDSQYNTYIPDFTSSTTVYNNFKDKEGNSYKNAKNASFTVELSADDSIDITDLKVKVLLDGSEIYDGDIKDIKSLVNSNVIYNIDTNEMVYKNDSSKVINQSNVKYISNMIYVYKLIGLPLFAFALAAFVMEYIMNFIRKANKIETRFSLSLIQLGLLLTVYANLLVIAVVYVESKSVAYIMKYSAGTIPVMQIFICIAITGLVFNIKEIINIVNKDEEEPEDKEDEEEEDEIIFIN